MGHSISKKKKISFLLVLYMLLIFINNKDLFLNVGINIRPYYFVVLLLFFYSPRLPKKRFPIVNIMILLYICIILFGILGWFFSPVGFQFPEMPINIVFIILQVLTFIVLIRSFNSCDINSLFQGIKLILPIITIFPLVIYLAGFMSRLGVRNEQVLGIYTGHDGIPRLIGLFEDPNYFSLYMVSFLLIVVFSHYSVGIELKIRDLVFVFIGIIDIILSLSRSAWAVLLLFLFLFSIVRKNKSIMIAGVFFLSAILVVVPLLDEDILGVAMERFENVGDDGSANERTLLLSEGLKAPLRAPVGIGVGNCVSYYQSLQSISEEKLAHNDWITVLIECGILGLFLYLIMWGKTFFQSDPNGKICLICVMIMLCTLSAYGYDPIVPTVLAYFTYFNKKRIQLCIQY